MVPPPVGTQGSAKTMTSVLGVAVNADQISDCDRSDENDATSNRGANQSAQCCENEYPTHNDIGAMDLAVDRDNLILAEKMVEDNEVDVCIVARTHNTKKSSNTVCCEKFSFQLAAALTLTLVSRASNNANTNPTILHPTNPAGRFEFKALCNNY